MIEVQQLADKVDDWKMRLKDRDTRMGLETLGLPITDEELDEWVVTEYYHAPPEVKVKDPTMSDEDHRIIEKKWMESMENKLVKELKKRFGDSFDEKKWNEFTKVCNQVFDPYDIDHYSLEEESKGTQNKPIFFFVCYFLLQPAKFLKRTAMFLFF